MAEPIYKVLDCQRKGVLGLPSGAVHLWLAYWMHESEDNESYISTRALAAMMNVDRNTVMKWQRYLIENGWLKLTGGGAADKYDNPTRGASKVLTMRVDDPLKGWLAEKMGHEEGGGIIQPEGGGNLIGGKIQPKVYGSGSVSSSRCVTVPCTTPAVAIAMSSSKETFSLRSNDRGQNQEQNQGRNQNQQQNPLRSASAVKPQLKQFLAELDDVLSWTADRGITSHTRFHIYRKNIEWLRAHDGDEERPRVHAQLASEGRLTEILSTMTESIEIVETIPALRRIDVDIPKQLLQRAFSGPADMSREDDASNGARNAMFELSVAAMAARRGLTPTLSNTNPDVSFQFEGRWVKIECKRVMSVNRIMERLKEGTKQLEKSVQRAASDIGIVAISVSKLLNPGDRFLVSHSPHEDLSRQLHDELKSNEQQLGRMQRPWVSGFIFYVSSASYVPGRGYTPTKSGTIFPLDLADQVFLSQLASALYV
jgi:hypothetical protein